MDVPELLKGLKASIEGARSMPMSASAVINRADVLAQIEAIADSLPGAFEQSDRVHSERDSVVAEARGKAERIVVEATRERDRLVSDSEVYRAGKREAEAVREVVERECDALRKETDEYVDGRLANLEISLTKTLEAVSRGRDRLRGRSDLGRLEDSPASEGFAFPERR